MKIEQVAQYRIILNDEEMSDLSQALKYCMHRLKEHPESGIHKCINPGRLTQMEKFISQKA